MEQNNTAETAHARTEFGFTVDLPYEKAAPLFGADAEQKWAPGWKPHFLYPVPAADIEGAVFRMGGETTRPSIWINTVFDLPGGRVQYVSILDQAVITRIDIRLAENGPAKTDVSVVYERTAITSGGHEVMATLTRADQERSADWQASINAYGARNP